MPPTERPVLTEYLFHTPLTTRWSDNDAYGHINNVAYYSYFDSVINLYLIELGGLDIVNSDVIGVVAESHCQYHAALAYPSPLIAGLRVDRLGNRAATYGIAVFAEGEDGAAAHGHVVHVFVDRATRKPIAIPQVMRDALARLVSS